MNSPRTDIGTFVCVMLGKESALRNHKPDTKMQEIARLFEINGIRPRKTLWQIIKSYFFLP